MHNLVGLFYSIGEAYGVPSGTQFREQSVGSDNSFLFYQSKKILHQQKFLCTHKQ